MNMLSKVLMACVLLCSLSAAQTSYVFKSFQNPGATITRVFGLNGRGELVGADNTLPGRHAFLVNRSDYFVLDPSGVLSTDTSFARGINNVGDVVGGYFDDDGNEHGFLLHHGVLTTLDVPFSGSVGTQLNSLNDSGTIVGVWVDTAFTAHGFVYHQGTFARLDYPGALDTSPFAINARGDIVGNWDADQSTVGHGFVFSNGQIFSIDVPIAFLKAQRPPELMTAGKSWVRLLVRTEIHMVFSMRAQPLLRSTAPRARTLQFGESMRLARSRVPAMFRVNVLDLSPIRRR